MLIPKRNPLLTGKSISFAEAARREKIAKAAILELELRKRQGELIEKDRVEAFMAKLAIQVRIWMEAIPAKVAPTVAGMDAPAEVVRCIQLEIETVLADLTKGIAGLDF
jgi:hypothetical protein